jgi:glycine cleavage system transcriptional repressor
MIILLEIPDDRLEPLSRELPEIGRRMDLQISLRPQQQEAVAVEGMRYRLKSYSLDQPGIVARISHVLRGYGVNIEELKATQTSAPFAGDPLFTAEMRLTVPVRTPLRKLRAELESLCNELNCDLDLDPE